MAVFEELPEELKMLILSKLPAKSLLRLKCVQKSWYSLIKSPRFTHLHRSSSPNHDCFLVRRYSLRQNVLSFYSFETLDNLGNEISLDELGTENNIPISDFRYWLCGSCDGLVCFFNYNQILICNPTIRELRCLSFPPSLGDRSGYDIDSVAFGSDPITGHYMLVMIFVKSYGDREAQVYDFSTDTWRETAVVVPCPFRYLCHAILFNGAFHWCPSGNHRPILTFSISNEVAEFEFIPLPDFVNVSHKKKLCVSTKSQLALIFYMYGLLEICVMTEYGVKDSWTRLFKIEPMLAVVPVAFWDEQRLLVQTVQGQLVSCNLQNQNLRHFPIVGDFVLYPFSQSLVSVNGIGHPII